MSGNMIGDEGAISLAEFLKTKGTKITVLNLSGNAIADEGMKALAEVRLPLAAIPMNVLWPNLLC